MNKEIAAPITSWAAATGASPWLRAAGTVLAGSALLAACAHIAVPLWFTPVPLTAMPFGVLLLGLLLTPRMAATTLAAYLVEGAMGLPVFVPDSALGAGGAHLLGPTAGYLLAYPVAAVLISYLWRLGGRGFSLALISAALGDLVILISGALWLASFTHVSAQTALTLGVLPFLPGDALKVAAAAGTATGTHLWRNRNLKPRPTA